MQAIKKDIEKYLKENEKLLKKYKLASRVVIAFPSRKKISLIIKLAMWFLNKKGAIIDTEFISTKK